MDKKDDITFVIHQTASKEKDGTCERGDNIAAVSSAVVELLAKISGRDTAISH